MRLLVVTPRELTRDGRARRQVDAAVASGREVVGLSAVLVDETPAPLDGVEITRVPVDRVSGPLRRVGLGGYRPSRSPIRELRGVWRLLRLAKTTLALVAAGRRLGRFDVVHANDLDALPAAFLLARRSNAKLVYDAHELYSVMESDRPHLYWAIAARLEAVLARRAVVVTNCEAFADAIERMLKLRRRPVVVLNAPQRDDTVPRPELHEPPLRAIYQASVVHAGRPLSDVFEAAERAADVHFTLRLLHFDESALRGEIARRGLDGRVELAAPVGPHEVVDALQGHDVGLVVNRPLTPNDELALPGKIFEYMMGGLAVAAPRLEGVRLLEEEGVGVTYAPGDGAALGEALRALADDGERLVQLRRRARELALERFNAEEQAGVLERVWDDA